MRPLASRRTQRKAPSQRERALHKVVIIIYTRLNSFFKLVEFRLDLIKIKVDIFKYFADSSIYLIYEWLINLYFGNLHLAKIAI